jgi:hypothetical protein
VEALALRNSGGGVQLIFLQNAVAAVPKRAIARSPIDDQGGAGVHLVGIWPHLSMGTSVGRNGCVPISLMISMHIRGTAPRN